MKNLKLLNTLVVDKFVNENISGLAIDPDTSQKYVSTDSGITCFELEGQVLSL